MTAVGGGVIEDSSLAVINDDQLEALAAAPVTSLDMNPMIPDAMNIYFAQEVRSSDAAGTLLGKAMGVPGAPSSVKRNGVDIPIQTQMYVGIAHNSKKNDTESRDNNQVSYPPETRLLFTIASPVAI